MSKQTTHQGKDVFQVYQKNVGKYFTEAEKTVPQYFQSVINSQKTFLDAWKNSFESVLDVQRKYAQKAQINTQIPEASTRAIEKAADGILKISQIQDQFLNATLDVSEETVKTFQNSAEAFADFNTNLIESWFTSFNNVRN